MSLDDLPEFAVALDAVDGHVTLTVRGDIDIATIDQLEDARGAALSREPRRLLIDLREVGFVDSSGLKFLIDTRRLAEREGWELALRRPGPGAMRVFTITGADRQLPFIEDERDHAA